MHNRHSDRRADELRPVSIQTGFMPRADGSALICYGDTHVVCTATVEESVPPFLKGSGRGWITAEYGMLPACAAGRIRRETAAGKPNGRTQEIQRLIGRSLRAAADLAHLGERQIIIDCDVIRADGGTRTAAVTGGFVALTLAVRKLLADGRLAADPIREQIAAVSVGMVDGRALLDLDYPEDSACGSDINLVMTASGKIVEIQGTAEGMLFDRAELDTLLDLGAAGIAELCRRQHLALSAAA